jgi:hypothetical protein
LKYPARKTGLCFLLRLAATPFLLSVFFLLQQDLIKQRMKQKLQEKLLTTVTIEAKNVQWMKPEKEIRVEGRFFDIHSYQVSGSQVIFKGLFDDEETDLLYTLEKNNEQGSALEDEIMSPLFQFLQSVYESVQEEDTSFLTTAPAIHPVQPVHLPEVYLGITTPPPQS